MTRPGGAPAPRLDVDHLLDRAEIIVCCGAGGVGKTTTSAALALRAAERGRKVVVLTIDPARRLAQSLGLVELDNTPRPVAGVDARRGGRLWAMQLDMKRTFDEIVQTHADPVRAAEIMSNPFYESMSSSFAGTQEYMAMEKLGQLRSQGERSGDWDLVVVDTPPTRSALDFLDAPQRMGTFLDGRMVRLLLAPAKLGGGLALRVVSAGMGLFSGILTRIIGTQVLRDLSLFVAGLESIFGGFRKRAEQTYRLLQDEGTAFVVVAAPERDALREASYFVDRLDDDGMPLAGLLLNRVHRPLARLGLPVSLAGVERLGSDPDQALARGVLLMHADRLTRAERDARLRDLWVAGHPTVPVVEVPAQAGDVNDLADLRTVGQALGG